MAGDWVVGKNKETSRKEKHLYIFFSAGEFNTHYWQASSLDSLSATKDTIIPC